MRRSTRAGTAAAALLAVLVTGCTSPVGSGAPAPFTLLALSTPPATAPSTAPITTPSTASITTSPPGTTAAPSGPSRTTAGSTPQRPSSRPQPTAASSTPQQTPTTPRPAARTSLEVTAADVTAARQLAARMSPADLAATVLMPSASQARPTAGRIRWGGVILMGDDGVVDETGDGTPPRVQAYVAGLQRARPAAWGSMLVAVDQEYGTVARLTRGFTDFPGAARIAGSGDADAVALTRESARAAAQEMRAVGVTVDFAPDADVVPADGGSPIGSRSYGSDPRQVGRFVAAAVQGYQSGGVAATLKHFPGIGAVGTDTHTSLPTLPQSCTRWNASSRVPFADGIAAGAAVVMTGHVRFPAIDVDSGPTSLSPQAVTRLLRGSGTAGCSGLGFRGLTVSDSFSMEPVTAAVAPRDAGWRGLLAGQDLVLLPQDPEAARDGIVAALADGRLPRERLTDAATAVLALTLATRQVEVPPLSVVNSAEHRALAARARG